MFILQDAPLYENVGPHINHSPNTRRKKMYGSSTCLDQMETDEKPESHLKRAHSLMGRHRQERRPKIGKAYCIISDNMLVLKVLV